MKYKMSRYNLCVKNDENVLIYNSLKASFTTLTVQDYDNICNGDSVILTKHRESLLEQGIIVEDNVDEKQLAKAKLDGVLNYSELQIIIMPTMNCNFACFYCYEEHTKTVISEEITNAIIKYVERNVSKFKKLHISWFGGEPTLCLQTIEKVNIECLEFARRNGVVFSSSITTNGYLLNCEIFNRLRKARVTRFQITIDGSEDEHNQSRPLKNGGPTYRRIIDNLCDIKRQVKSQTFKIVIRMNLRKSNYSGLINSVNYLSELFAEDKRFELYTRNVGDWGGKSIRQFESELLFTQDSALDNEVNSRICAQLQYNKFFRGFQCYASNIV